MTENLCSYMLSLSIAIRPDEKEVVISSESFDVCNDGFVVLW